MRLCSRLTGKFSDRVLVPLDCERVAVGPAAAEKLDQQLEVSGFFETFFGGLAPFPE
jgi:hypothetical protein